MFRGDINWRLALLLPLAVLAGCVSTPRLGGDPNLQVYTGSAMPEPDSSDVALDAHPYFVGPFDKLTIDVFGIPELSGREVQVDQAGRIYFPPAGSIDVTGKIPSEVQDLLAERLRASHVRDPQVTVLVKESVSQIVTIEGEVKEPGLYPVRGHMTLLRAMALSKGVSEFAKLDDVVIFRTVKRQRYAALYNLKAIRQGAQPDPVIYANDVVVVGDSQARRLFKDILTLMPLATTPILLINNLTR